MIIYSDLPALLKIRQIENTIMIDPTPNINGVIYSVTSSNNITTKGILNDSAFLIEESDAVFYFNVSFICIETSIIFNIGKFYIIKFYTIIIECYLISPIELITVNC